MQSLIAEDLIFTFLKSSLRFIPQHRIPTLFQLRDSFLSGTMPEKLKNQLQFYFATFKTSTSLTGSSMAPCLFCISLLCPTVVKCSFSFPKSKGSSKAETWTVLKLKGNIKPPRKKWAMCMVAGWVAEEKLNNRENWNQFAKGMQLLQPHTRLFRNVNQQ